MSSKAEQELSLPHRTEELHMYLTGISSALNRGTNEQAKRRHQHHVRTVELLRNHLDQETASDSDSDTDGAA